MRVLINYKTIKVTIICQVRLQSCSLPKETDSKINIYSESPQKSAIKKGPQGGHSLPDNSHFWEI
jgi:hypothetical protein